MKITENCEVTTEINKTTENNKATTQISYWFERTTITTTTTTTTITPFCKTRRYWNAGY